jgi:hypothetical protein
MIAGLSKAVVVFLAPILALTSILLSLFAFLAPTLMLEDRVALMTVTPSTVITQNGRDEDVDGPTIFFGVLGALFALHPCISTEMRNRILQPPEQCRRCKLYPSRCKPSLWYVVGFSNMFFVPSPAKDLSQLPSDAPQHLLSAPAASSASFIAVALAFSVIFFFTFSFISLRHKMGEKMAATLDKPMVQRFSAWLGFIGFMIGRLITAILSCSTHASLGLTAFLIIRMWFDKAVDDFNNSIEAAHGPDLKASIGNAFTSKQLLGSRAQQLCLHSLIVVWVAYAFYAVPLIASLAKINVTATKA